MPSKFSILSYFILFFWSINSGFSQSYEEHLNIGLEYQRNKDYENSIKSFSKAIELNPELSAEAYANRSESYFLSNQTDKALKDIDKAINFEPQETRYYNIKAFRLNEIGEYEASKLESKISLSLDSINFFTHYNLGISEGHLKNYQKSIYYLSKSIELNPDFSDSYYNRGTLKKDYGYYEEALPDLDLAIQLSSGFYDAYNNRGLVKSQLNDFEGGISDFTIAIEIDPKNTSAYLNRGVVKTKIKDYDGAIADYNLVLSIDSNNY